MLSITTKEKVVCFYNETDKQIDRNPLMITVYDVMLPQKPPLQVDFCQSVGIIWLYTLTKQDTK